MKQTIGVITLPVASLPRSKDFYCKGLGWSPVFDDGDVAFFQFNGFVLALWSRASFERDIGEPSLAGGFKMALAHNVDSRQEVDRVMGLAGSLAARILKPATAQPWGGYCGYFADPDDHVWEVAHNPAWPISKEGYLSYRP
jgi:catechol 2,3-dioxygenase-like lactoylglutathione lyase family enzyme